MISAPTHVHGFTFDETFTQLCAIGHAKLALWKLKGEEPAVAPKPPASGAPHAAARPAS